MFEAVQLERVFPDSKTFVDMIPRETPAAIMEAYAREKPTGRAALAAFVARHFAVATPDRLDDILRYAYYTNGNLKIGSQSL